MCSNSAVSHCAADKGEFQRSTRRYKTKDRVAIVTHLQRHMYPEVRNEKKPADDSCYAAYSLLLRCKSMHELTDVCIQQHFILHYIILRYVLVGML